MFKFAVFCMIVYIICTILMLIFVVFAFFATSRFAHPKLKSWWENNWCKTIDPTDLNF